MAAELIGSGKFVQPNGKIRSIVPNRQILKSSIQHVRGASDRKSTVTLLEVKIARPFWDCPIQGLSFSVLSLIRYKRQRMRQLAAVAWFTSRPQKTQQSGGA